MSDIARDSTCGWCGKIVDESRIVEILSRQLCLRCSLLAYHSLELGRQIALELPKGGVQIYLGIERTGQPNGLVSVKRWSPLEPLESAESAEQHLHTYPLPQE